jgi:glutathione S-transferase
MKLYSAPGFSSLADHIALLEAGVTFDLVKVDFDTKRMDAGGSFLEINPKGQVPALLFDDGELLTENVAILAWAADREPRLAPDGPMGRYRLLEMLGFIASEIHKRFPIMITAPEDAKAGLRDQILRWFEFLAPRVERDHLFGDRFSAADAYLYVMARGAVEVGFPVPEALRRYIARIEKRESVRQARRREGLEAS